MKTLLFTFAFALILINSSAQEEKPEIIKVGDSAPTFTIKTLDNKTFNTSELKGKVIYLNFFATWCGPCMKEMPFIESDIWNSIKNPDFVMLSIAREHSYEDIIKFKLEKGYTFPFAADPKRKVYSMFAPQNIPRNIIINKEGKIIFSKHGFNKNEFEEMIKLIKSELK